MPTTRQSRIVAAAEFKAKCLALMDEVQRTGQELIVTKHGKAVVKIVPAQSAVPSAYGCMAGTVRVLGDIVGPSPELWESGPDTLDTG